MPVGYTVLLLSAKTRQENQCNEASHLRKCIKKSTALSHVKCEDVSLQIEFTTLPPKNHNLFVKLERKGNWRNKEMRPQANNAQYNMQGWDVGGESVKTVGGRGWAAPLFQLIYEPGEMVWQYIYFSTLLKRDFYLQRFKSEGQQKPGDVALMQSDCKWLHRIFL